MTRSEAQTLIADIKKMREVIDDQLASSVVNIYPKLKGKGTIIKAGTRIYHKGEIKRAIADIEDIEDNSPDSSPSLWEDIEYKEGYRIIPNAMTVATSFAKGEIGIWNNQKYKSLYDNNIWTPEEDLASWRKENE